tara:strand:- start:642 stop:1175 length:534 start_codon:yes stop_codon:yes gene_type:complete
MNKLVVVLGMIGLLLTGVVSGQDADVDEVQNENLPDCDLTIGITSSGIEYDQTDVTIEVGDTVCWQWENESMAHNVAETETNSDNERKNGGIYSGEANTTVDFRHTFEEDYTFFYMCEPHVSLDMRGKITVGNGTSVVTPEPIEQPEPSTVPGFGILLVTISILGALIVVRNVPRNK